MKRRLFSWLLFLPLFCCFIFATIIFAMTITDNFDETKSLSDIKVFDSGASRNGVGIFINDFGEKDLVIGNFGKVEKGGIWYDSDFSINPDSLEVHEAMFDVKFGDKTPSVNFSFGDDNLNFKFVGYGLYDSSDNDYIFLKAHNSIVPDIVGDHIFYRNIVDGIDVQYNVSGFGISKQITFINRTLNILPNDFSEDSFIVFVERIDGDLPDNGGDLSDGVMKFKDVYIPKVDNVFKKVFVYDGIPFLFTAIRYNFYDSQSFPFSIDPDLTISTAQTVCGDWGIYDNVNISGGGGELVINIGCNNGTANETADFTWIINATKDFIIEEGVSLNGVGRGWAGGVGGGAIAEGLGFGEEGLWKVASWTDCNNQYGDGGCGAGSYGNGGLGAKADGDDRCTSPCDNNPSRCGYGYPYLTGYSLYCGSGGGGGGSCGCTITCTMSDGGDGGAGIFIQGGNCNLNVSIDMSGTDGRGGNDNSGGGGGSGGDIFVICETLKGDLNFTSKGGSGGQGGGGGYAGGGASGGRIYVWYTDNQTISGLFNVSGGQPGIGSDVGVQFGSDGSIIFDYVNLPPSAFGETVLPLVPVFSDTIFFNVHLNDSGRGEESIDYCNFTLEAPNGSIVANENGTYEEFTFPYDLNWSSQIYTIDDSGNWSWNFTYEQTENGTVVNSSVQNSFIIANAIAPTVVVTFPENNTDYLYSDVDMNFSVVDDIRVRDCWYELNGTDNFTILDCANSTVTWALETHNITVYANDSSGNEGMSGFYNFSVSADTSVPIIAFTNPASNGTTVTSSPIIISMFVSDNVGLDICWYAYYLDGLQLGDNMTVTCNDDISKTVSDGIFYTIEYYANDSTSNEGFSEISWFGSIAAPSLVGAGGGGGPPEIIMVTVPFCGDNICQPEYGENIFNCRIDCATLSRLRTGEIFGAVVVRYIVTLVIILLALLTIKQETYEDIGKYIGRRAGRTYKEFNRMGRRYF